jgi:hypothetical protein
MLSTVFRRSGTYVLQSARKTPKRNPEKRGAIKNALRLAAGNKFTFDMSPQKETHRWINDRRIKAMVKSIETAFNTNRLTQKIDPKSAKAYMDSMKSMERRLYWEKMKYVDLMERYRQHHDKFFEEDIMNLPGYLKDEYEIAMKQDGEAADINLGIVEEYNPDNYYWEQTMRLNSEEEAKILNLQYRIRKILESRLMEDE